MLGRLVDEILIGAAVILITTAVWPRWGRLALVVPGLVLLWLALPQRAPFVYRPPVPPVPDRKKE